MAAALTFIFVAISVIFHDHICSVDDDEHDKARNDTDDDDDVYNDYDYDDDDDVDNGGDDEEDYGDTDCFTFILKLTVISDQRQVCPR